MGGYGRVFEHSISRETSGSDIKVAVKEEMRSVSNIVVALVNCLLCEFKKYTSCL